MESKPYHSDADYDGQRPTKRARYTPPTESNGHGQHADQPPLSLSILGVEPLDEFIREVADFIHHMIMTRPNREGTVEVEAKVGVLREKGSGQRLGFPVLVETSTYMPRMQVCTILYVYFSSCSGCSGYTFRVEYVTCKIPILGLSFARVPTLYLYRRSISISTRY